MDFFYLLIALQLKHFIVDFPLQCRYQWANKGRYGHPGGLIHAALHGIGTLGIILWFTNDLQISGLLAALDMIVHYHIDWAKMRLNARYNLTPERKEFWWALGFDQLLHQLTYIAIVFALTVI